MNDCDNYVHGILKGICTDTIHIHSVIFTEDATIIIISHAIMDLVHACIHENNMNSVTNKQTSLSHSNACQAQ